MLVIDGCDNAILWYADTQAGTVVVYLYEDLVEVFVEQGMDYGGAVEWVEFNILGAYMGERSPLVVFSADRCMINRIAESEQ
jgi:hypothetical protein